VRQVRIHGPGDVRVDEVPEPVPGPRDAVVRVRACGICGSDLSYVKNGGVAGPQPEPMPLGHELSGVVEAIGSEVEGVEVGTRVVVNPLRAGHLGNGGPTGAFAPRVRVPDAASGGALIPIPDALPDDLAALAEPLGVGLNGVLRSGARPGQRVAVFGAGPIGLACVASLRDRGVEDVVSVDLSERRLEIARQLGARAAIHAGEQDAFRALRELHGTEPVLGAPMAGTDVYIEATGVQRVLTDVVAHAKARARLAVVGLHYGEVPVSFIAVMAKELEITGAMAYPEDWSGMIDLLCRADLSPMITHRFPLEAFPEALEVARSQDAGAKVLIEPG